MSLSKLSLEKLETCSEPLRELILKVSEFYPCVVTEGHRSKERQDEAFEKGFSKVKWPDGRHNSYPSFAVDVAPIDEFGRVDWNDKNKFYHFAGFVLGVAKTLGIEIRWGGDWNSNLNLKDQTFFDLPHFELVTTKGE